MYFLTYVYTNSMPSYAPCGEQANNPCEQTTAPTPWYLQRRRHNNTPRKIGPASPHIRRINAIKLEIIRFPQLLRVLVPTITGNDQVLSLESGGRTTQTFPVSCPYRDNEEHRRCHTPYNPRGDNNSCFVKLNFLEKKHLFPFFSCQPVIRTRAV